MRTVHRQLIVAFAVLLFALLPACSPSLVPSPGAGPPLPVATSSPAPTLPRDAQPADRPEPAGKALSLVNGTLIDGTGNNPVPDAAVLIHENRIIAVGPRASISIPADATILDVQGAAILPGFINSHIHRGYSASNLQAWAQAGVTTVRELGTSPGASSFTMRDTLLRDDRNARLVSAGPMITVPDGYPMVPWGSSGLIVNSTEDAAAKANQLLDQGADLLKISLEAGSTFGKEIPVLSTDQAAAIVQIAHRRSTPVSAHITANQDLRRVVAAGVDDIAHMAYNPVPDETIQKIVQAGIYWVPTLELWHVVGAAGTQPITNLQRFVAAGGRVALGTDYAGYAGTFDLGMPVHEIEGMRAAGMTPMQIIVAATRNAAHVSNLDAQLGTLEAGKIADILVVDGDPLQDLHALTNVRLVIHNGTVIRGQ